MSREQRTRDNWSLLYAQQQALQNEQPLAVVFNFVPSYLGSTKRIHSFMIEGLKEVSRKLKEYGIPFFLLFVCYSRFILTSCVLKYFRENQQKL